MYFEVTSTVYASNPVNEKKGPPNTIIADKIKLTMNAINLPLFK